MKTKKKQIVIKILVVMAGRWIFIISNNLKSFKNQYYEFRNSAVIPPDEITCRKLVTLEWPGVFLRPTKGSKNYEKNNINGLDLKCARRVFKRWTPLICLKLRHSMVNGRIITYLMSRCSILNPSYPGLNYQAAQLILLPPHSVDPAAATKLM
ncbi:hypothetical protein JYU34_021224 [Plutella xylostella]|uniref:Uncharacterized protein n=1 Tax=Plutella xylostella TaxID=51655 RepID=A0ABQ7PT34_PLUXY|nr:hypothetical protein JYU34_021224 [Plutella xylostella]